MAINERGGLEGIGAVLNEFVDSRAYISIKDFGAKPPPDHLPDAINLAFREASTCVAVECFNAAGAMFRLCIDLATESLLPVEETEGLKPHTRKYLGARLLWLFQTGRLHPGLQELSQCITYDGNDGVHDGSLTKLDAEDLYDFTYALLERLYTEPAKLALANERRARRRQPED